MWPKDELRPQVQFADFVKRGVEKRLAAGKTINEEQELKQLNALYSLAEDRYIDKVRTHRHGTPTTSWMKD